MDKFSFMDAYEKRGGDMSENGQDQAALYYASVKRNLHDRQARGASATCSKKVQWIRALLTKVEAAAFKTNRIRGPRAAAYRHIQVRRCMDREDAVGDVMKSFWARDPRRWSATNRLAQLAALDDQLAGKPRLYHRLAKEIGGLQNPAIEIICRQEESVVFDVYSWNPHAVYTDYLKLTNGKHH